MLGYRRRSLYNAAEDRHGGVLIQSQLVPVLVFPQPRAMLKSLGEVTLMNLKV